MFLKRSALLVSALLLGSALISPSAIAASTATPKPFTVVPKVVGIDLAKKGCDQVGVSLQLNNAFLKLPAKEQTSANKTRTIAAENAAMANAMKTFAAAAKANKKWKTLADDINTFLKTSDADTFTKAFSGLLTACSQINPKK